MANSASKGRNDSLTGVRVNRSTTKKRPHNIVVNNTSQRAQKQQPVQEANVPGAIIQRVRENPATFTHADAMVLQKTIGNRAVGRLIEDIKNTGNKPFQKREDKNNLTLPSGVNVVQLYDIWSDISKLYTKNVELKKFWKNVADSINKKDEGKDRISEKKGCLKVADIYYMWFEHKLSQGDKEYFKECMRLLGIDILKEQDDLDPDKEFKKKLKSKQTQGHLKDIGITLSI